MTITDACTAEDLGLTGWVLHAHTIDGEDWIITEVLDYHHNAGWPPSEWADLAPFAGKPHRALVAEYYTPGALGPVTYIGRLEGVRAVWHGEAV